MPDRSYQVRGSSSRTALITIRVSPEERELLHELAAERGETLSRMLVSRSLTRRTRAKRKKAAARAQASEPVATSASACVPEPALPARPDAKRVRDAGVIPGQQSLLDQMGGW